jgi:hypothetical protein
MIPFRTQRMATSVVNRLLNFYHGLPPETQPGPPAAPDPQPAGQALDAQFSAPKGATDADPQTAEQIALEPLAK